MKETPDRETQDTVRQIFSAFLEKNGYRKTPERFSILREIYNTPGHFDVEFLFEKLKDKYRVSRATIYNSLELMRQCKLVAKLQLGGKSAQYEKAFKYSQHDHVVCMGCGKMYEFCDPRIQEIKTSIEKIFNLTITHHALTFYALCHEKCQKNKDNVQKK